MTGGVSNWVTLANKTCTGSPGNWTLDATVVFSDGHTMRLGRSTGTAPGMTDLHIEPGYKGRNDFNVTNSDFDMCPGAFGN
jgi:hypothetical protein